MVEKDEEEVVVEKENEEEVVVEKRKRKRFVAEKGEEDAKFGGKNCP